MRPFALVGSLAVVSALVAAPGVAFASATTHRVRAHHHAVIASNHVTHVASIATRSRNDVEIQPSSALGPDIRELQFRGAAGGLEVTEDAHHFSNVDGGRLQVRVPDHNGTQSTWAVIGGMVRLTTGGYAPIARGELHVTREGHGWALAGGSLSRATDGSTGASQRVEDVLPSTANSLVPIAPTATSADLATSGNAHNAGPVILPARTLAALDRLLSLAPEGSRDSIRLASATEVTIHNAESATPSVFTTPIIGRTVVLVVDTSYSMRDRDPAATDASIDPSSPPSKLDVAKAELVRMLATLPPTTQVNIVAFSSSITTLWSAPRSVDDASLDEAIRWVAALQPGDETEPLPALRAADAMNADQIVFVSDGRPTNHDEDDRALLTVADTIASHRARLDIVGIGSDQDAAFIDQVAARGGGAAHHR